ncbi:MAG: hypothetical protein KAJ03_04160, partial [Gammaproteobacteria bacterium]|nr:hypothetical protein [Gammaproteobacteria bacterium]
TDTDWKFWVVVWIEDSNGNLIDELDEHGLNVVPPMNLTSLADIEVQTYSNNLGYYNQTFSLFLPASNTAAALTPGALNPVTEQRELAIERIEIDPATPIAKHKHSIIRVHHQASGDRYDNVIVLLYEGDPQDGGQLLDMDHVPRMAMNEPHVVPFPYVPQTCGSHTLFVQTIKRDGTDPLTESIAFDLPCKPSAIANFQGTAKSVGKGKQQKDVVQLKGEFTLNRAHHLPGIDLAAAVGEVTLDHLLDEVGGNGELVESLPLILVANPQNSDDSAVYQTLPGEEPAATLRIKALMQPGTYSFKLKIKKAAIGSPDGCPMTTLLTRFTIEDGGTMPVHAVTQASWACNGKSGTMKTK